MHRLPHWSFLNAFSISLHSETLTAHRPPAVRLHEAMSYSRPRFYPLDPRALSRRACVFACGSAASRKSRQLYRQPVSPAVSMDILSLHHVKEQLQIFDCQGTAQSEGFGRYSVRSGCFPPLLRLIYIIHLFFPFLYDTNVEISISFIPFMVILLQNQILAHSFLLSWELLDGD